MHSYHCLMWFGFLSKFLWGLETPAEGNEKLAMATLMLDLFWGEFFIEIDKNILLSWLCIIIGRILLLDKSIDFGLHIRRQFSNKKNFSIEYSIELHSTQINKQTYKSEQYHNSLCTFDEFAFFFLSFRFSSTFLLLSSFFNVKWYLFVGRRLHLSQVNMQHIFQNENERQDGERHIASVWKWFVMWWC